MKLRVALLAGVFLACGALAQELTDPVPLLIPIHVGSHHRGAFDTVWATEPYVTNGSDRDLVYFGGACNLGVICPTFKTLRPRITAGLPIYPGNPGYLLWLSRVDEKRFHATIRMFERSRNEIPGGVAIPIVRERDFRESIVIAGVPRVAEHRYHLRIYGVPEQRSHTEDYEVELVDWEGTVIWEGVVRGEAPGSAGRFLPDTPLPVAPVFGFVDLGEAVGKGEGVVTVRVRALSGARLWTFLTLTHNPSQAVSLALPD